MKRNLKRISTVNMPHSTWLKHRMMGIGCSEIGTVLGINKYEDRITYWHRKVGTIPQKQIDNIAMFAGRAFEDTVVREFWRYWNPEIPTVEEMMKNGVSKTPVRKAQNVNAFVINPKYPWLFASLDRKINKQYGKPEGVLEIKTAQSYAVKQWIADINPSYVTQVLGNFICTDLTWGEIFMVQDGRFPNCFEIEQNKETQDMIIQLTHDFWESVLIARDIMSDDSIPLEERLQMISEYEPEPSGPETYNEHLKEQYRGEIQVEKVVSNEKINKYLSEYVDINKKIKELTLVKTEMQNNVMAYMQNNNANELEYNGELLCSWRMQKGGTPKFLPKTKAIQELV